MAQASPYSDKPISHGEDAMSSLSDRSREVGDNLQQVATNIKSAVDRSLRDQPLTTLGVAAVVGFVIGALWKS